MGATAKTAGLNTPLFNNPNKTRKPVQAFRVERFCEVRSLRGLGVGLKRDVVIHVIKTTFGGAGSPLRRGC